MNPSTRTLLQTVSQYWKGFDLDSKRVMLDAQGVAMQEQKEHSLKSRKLLAEHTKRFRKLADPEKIPAMPSLLKAYQEEIDTLTKRAKFSDNAFFTLYKALYEAPDPVPALDAALDQLTPLTAAATDSSDEITKLRKELAAYETEFASLKNQDITIRNLENKLQQMEDSMDRMVEEQVDERCRDLEKTLRLREEDFEMNHAQLDKSISQARNERDDALAQLDLMRSEVFQVKQRLDQMQTMHMQETQSFVTEMDRLRAVQLENQLLKQKLETASTSTSFQEAPNVMHLELALAQKEAHLSSSLRELENVRASAAHEKQLWTAQVSTLEAQVASLEAQIARLNEQAKAAAAAAAAQVQPVQDTANARMAELEKQLAFNNQQWQTQQSELIAQLQEQEAQLAHQRQVIAQLEATLERAVPSESTDASAILGGVLLENDQTKETKLVSIMRQQRDRLKDKVKEMDTDLHAALAAKHQLTTRLKQLEHENVELVQKMRYVSNSTGATPDVEAGSLHKYQTLYDERMNPFDQFKQMESTARVAQLNPLDKILLVSARLILSHPYTRMGLLVYLLLLHLLVVLTLYLSMHLCNISNAT
ncbi:unnamed protein product [Aphanomyces euteiches]|uniref:Protein CASP n=1 Tax=Aphanomyces euteiches TaxID=100861 RepID=A0A6G0W936_9STRA|nr:hypothetical protein Ae201684_017396 [Aphanomyces euteiches]KAH9132274.1 hypothetical protein AeRB84_021260 [Aphanomyces euteiches]